MAELPNYWDFEGLGFVEPRSVKSSFSKNGEEADHDDNHEPESQESSYQAMNPQQQLARTNHGSRSSTSLGNNFRQPFGTQRKLSPYAAPYRPRNTYQQDPVANQIPNPVPPMQQTQMIVPGPASVDHNYAPWRPQNAYQQHPMGNEIPNLVPMQQTQMTFPGAAFVDHNRAPWIPQNSYQQHPMGNEMANLVPTQTMISMRDSRTVPWYEQQQHSNYWEMRPLRQRMYQNQHPMRMPQSRSDQTMISPSGQPRSSAVSRNYVNPQQHSVLPELNRQQMQQPTQSQGFDAGASFEQGQDQHQPSGQPRSVPESSTSAAASDSNATVNTVSGESSTNAAISGESSTSAAASDSNAPVNAVLGESSTNVAASDSNAKANAVSGV